MSLLFQLTARQKEYLNRNLPIKYILAVSYSQQVKKTIRKQPKKEIIDDIDFEEIIPEIIVPIKPAKIIKEKKQSIKEISMSNAQTSECHLVLEQLILHEYSYIFRQAVDPVAHNCPDYFDVISEPMDLSLIQDRLNEGFYKTQHQFTNDLEKIWQNSYSYNNVTDPIYQITQQIDEYSKELFIHLDDYSNDNAMKKLKNKKLKPQQQIKQLQQELLQLKQQQAQQQQLQYVQHVQPAYQHDQQIKPIQIQKPCSAEEIQWIKTQLQTIPSEYFSNIPDIIDQKCELNELTFNISTLPGKQQKDLLKYVKNQVKFYQIQQQNIQKQNPQPLGENKHQQQHFVQNKDNLFSDEGDNLNDSFSQFSDSEQSL